MMRGNGWRGALAMAMACVAVLAASCGVEAGRPVAAPAAEELSSTEVLAELRDAVALIETPAGSGSSVLLPDGYLLTNAHVVDPFTSVDVTFEGADTEVDVPVVGIDLEADLAVVGPVSTDAEPATIVDPLVLEPGSEVYLVGFPGDQREQEVTLASGVVSRTRSADPWGLEYLQTDTTIGGGQSGGALVDTSGRVVGISGLEDEDGFAYSLSGADVIARLDELLDGGDQRWRPAPKGPLATEFTADAAEYIPTALYLPHVAEEVELAVTVPSGTAVAYADPGDLVYPWAVNEAGADVGDDAYWYATDVEVLDSDDGTVSIEIYAGTDAVVLVLPPPDGEPVSVTTSLEMVEFELPDVAQAIAVGETSTGVLNRIDDSVVYEIELDEGETVEIAARSANGDMAWDALHEDAATGASEERTTVDDGGGGLFDLDAVGTYEAQRGGYHYIVVYDYDDTAIAYELTVTAA